MAPRVVFNFNNVRFSTELDITSVSYGKADEFGKVSDTTNVLNVRGLVAVYYFF